MSVLKNDNKKYDEFWFMHGMHKNNIFGVLRF